MIRHIVFLKMKDDVSNSQIESAFGELDALKQVLPGIREAWFGVNVSSEGLNRGYTHAFTFDFEDEEARDQYLVHPAHQRAGESVVALMEGGIEGVQVIDIEIAG